MTGYRSGFASFVGRPNAGKSTLTNALVGRKVAITSDKPQTTRTRVVGVKNYERGQVVFVDTPGVHKPAHRMNVRMVDVALEAIREVDVLALVVDSSVKSGPGDRYLLDLVKGAGKPVADAEGTVVLPDGKKEKVKTDADGYTATFEQTGRFAAYLRHTETRAGEHGGQKYEEVRHYATLVTAAAK